ncbi:pyridoxamine 5'-phosphate oxidase family protein [Nocardioides zhouii]|uniref:Pyridoxamine 5'-phosphate oxidase family protein n=1 Tax=Nocardioides zhouii TaxID=1168729 RepID=A0A4Q2TAI6_9ACTN|nr:pyridoxamine 5'-phosphate oxidase family protein [Nocardioides zhouii]RYC13869.1 hypothetical protein EUA94_04590 [Nocardioides zhouii]
MRTSKANTPRTFTDLGADECWRLVGVHGVGRVVFAGATYTRVVPTTYDAIHGTAYFRAPTFGELARRADGHEVLLCVDNVDRHDLTGWSVEMTGTAHRVEDAATVATLWSLGRPQSWFPGLQTQWIALPVAQVRGQRVSDHRYRRGSTHSGTISDGHPVASDGRRLTVWENEGGQVRELPYRG